jgi:hypothetical protein
MTQALYAHMNNKTIKIKKIYTSVDPESQVGEVLLKDKFFTQLASDIHRELQKVVAKGERSLDQLGSLLPWCITTGT